MSSVSIRLDEKEDKLVREYAKLKKMSLSELFRDVVLEKIEDEIDLTTFNKAIKDMKKTYTFDEVKKDLGL